MRLDTNNVNLNSSGYLAAEFSMPTQDGFMNVLVKAV